MAKKAKAKAPQRRWIPCVEKRLPEELWVSAADRAIDIFPANAPLRVTDPQRIAVLATKFWGARAADLTVGFMESVSAELRDRILSHANAWSEFARVRFRWTQTSPVIRVSLGRGGYWSYLGSDCLSIPANQPTMNLEGFSLRTPESEYRRVVRHEFGHSLGAPHEHQRQAIINLLDERKTVAYFMRTQGWSEQEVRQQIFVPLEERSLMGASPQADTVSIMTYGFGGQLTRSGQPIPGGLDFSPVDREYFAKIYPKPEEPPPPPPAGGDIATLVALDASGREVARFRR